MKVQEILEYIARSVYNLGRDYSFAGDLSSNTKAQFDALTWTDPLPKPTWSFVTSQESPSDAWHAREQNPLVVLKTRGVQQVNLLADLKAMVPSVNQKVLLAGKLTMNDGYGGLYYWDPLSADANDAIYLNVVQSDTVTGSGRWRRIVARISVLPHGTLVNITGVKTFYASKNTDANGAAQLYLTDTGLAGGAALFSEVWSNSSRAQTTATGPSQAVQSYTQELTSDLKSTTHGFYKANALTITLGLVYAPFASVGAGIPVQFEITGI